MSIIFHSKAGNCLLQQSDPAVDLWITLPAEHSYSRYSESPEGWRVPSMMNKQGENLYEKEDIF